MKHDVTGGEENIQAYADDETVEKSLLNFTELYAIAKVPLQTSHNTNYIHTVVRKNNCHRAGV